MRWTDILNVNLPRSLSWAKALIILKIIDDIENYYYIIVSPALCR